MTIFLHVKTFRGVNVPKRTLNQVRIASDSCSVSERVRTHHARVTAIVQTDRFFQRIKSSQQKIVLTALVCFAFEEEVLCCGSSVIVKSFYQPKALYGGQSRRRS